MIIMSSFWIESTKDNGKSKIITQNYNVDVCIIGAGMAGLSIGYYLSKNVSDEG